ncbi:MAG: transcription termination factor Rho [Verrucomicrobia bacterium]|nr:transcription termination factor Rho [Verrucomicrobiota bacterium]
MDDLETPTGENATDAPAKRVRKPAVKRARPSASVPEVANVLAFAAQTLGESPAGESSASAPEAKRPKTRRGKAPVAHELAEAAVNDSAPAEPVWFQEPAPQDKPDNAHFDATPSPPTPAAEYETQAPFSASFSPDDTAPELESAPERPVFIPSGAEPSSGATEENTQAPGAPAGPENPSNSSAGFDAAGAARREERKSWWERKKEKKRQKWLERQQQGGGGHGGGHFAGPAPLAQAPARPAIERPAFAGGANSAFAGRERLPAQPLPPVLQGLLGGLPDPSRFLDLAAVDAMAETLAQDAQPVDLSEIHAFGAGELAQKLRAWGETIIGMPPRRMLVDQIFAWAARENRTFTERGLLDLSDAGHGFVVHSANSYRLYPESTFVPAVLVKRHALRRGQEIDVLVQPPRSGERCPAAVRVLSVMGTTPELAREVTAFEELTPYYPTQRILVEAPEIHKDISMRAVDLLTPIGFGQRGLIVAPPRTGKTVLLQNIANSITHNFPEATLLLLLIDERPEEVTDFRRHTKGEVVSSTFDEAPESHIHAAEMVIEKARRLVEMGKHVVILLDSITRLARAYNALAGNSGKIMSGGIEANALQRPKRFFGSARNIEGGGSLTILGTALVDTNSRMDEVIFEEFKGTGNMELHLDRGLSDKRIFPAINIDRSGTRKEELIYHPEEMLRVYGLRRAMQGIPPVEAMDMFIQRLKKTRTNAEFLLSLNR